MKNFLGRGVGFPVGVNAFGAFKDASHNDSVEQAIRLVLGTALGERMMEPQFGCAIHDYIFYPNDPNTCSMVSIAVRESLKKWEPRVEGLRVSSNPDPESENVILVRIEYKLRTTNNLRNMVYPFYLRREQDL